MAPTLKTKIYGALMALELGTKGVATTLLALAIYDELTDEQKKEFMLGLTKLHVGFGALMVGFGLEAVKNSPMFAGFSIWNALKGPQAQANENTRLIANTAPPAPV